MPGQANNFDTGALTLLSGVNVFGVASGAGTYVGQFQNLSHRGLKLSINITAISGTTPTLTVTILGKDPVSGATYVILASAALNATGETVLTVYPGVTVAANLSVSDVLPPTFVIQAVVGGTGPSVTATIVASYIY